MALGRTIRFSAGLRFTTCAILLYVRHHFSRFGLQLMLSSEANFLDIKHLSRCSYVTYTYVTYLRHPKVTNHKSGIHTRKVLLRPLPAQQTK